MKSVRGIILLATLLGSAAFSHATILKIHVFSKQPIDAADFSADGLTVDGKKSPSIRVRATEGYLTVGEGEKKKKHNFLVIEASGPIKVNPRSKVPARYYQGSLRVTNKGGRLRILNDVNLEDYVTAALIIEAGQVHHPEALLAMAIVSRSYAIGERRRHRKEGFDFCDSTHCQVYKDAGKAPSRLAEAVQKTAGQFVTFHGKIIPTYYHAACGGATESAAEVWGHAPTPYLVSVNDVDILTKKPYCSISPQFTWSSKMTVGELETLAKAQGWLRPAEKLSEWTVTKRSPSGRAKRLELRTAKNQRLVSASQTFLAVGRKIGWKKMRSTWFHIDWCGPNKTSFCLKGKGYGHGVGFCQNGAEGRARAGQLHYEILPQYFPGTKVEFKEP